MDGIQFKLDTQQALGTIEGIEDRADDLTPLMREISAVLADQVEQAFEDQADPSTRTPWEPLAASTIAQRTKKGTWPGRILQRTGLMAASFSTDYGSDFAAIGSNLIRAAVHQLGAKAGRGGSAVIPARPMIGLSEDGLEEILDLAGRHLSGS